VGKKKEEDARKEWALFLYGVKKEGRSHGRYYLILRKGGTLDGTFFYHQRTSSSRKKKTENTALTGDVLDRANESLSTRRERFACPGKKRMRWPRSFNSLVNVSEKGEGIGRLVSLRMRKGRNDHVQEKRHREEFPLRREEGHGMGGGANSSSTHERRKRGTSPFPAKEGAPSTLGNSIKNVTLARRGRDGEKKKWGSQEGDRLFRKKKETPVPSARGILGRGLEKRRPRIKEGRAFIFHGQKRCRSFWLEGKEAGAGGRKGFASRGGSGEKKKRKRCSFLIPQKRRTAAELQVKDTVREKIVAIISIAQEGERHLPARNCVRCKGKGPGSSSKEEGEKTPKPEKSIRNDQGPARGVLVSFTPGKEGGGALSSLPGGGLSSWKKDKQ